MHWIKNIIKVTYLKVKYCRKNVKIHCSTVFNIHSHFEGYNKIGTGGSFSGSIGYCSYIGNNCRISAQIGRYCSLANDIQVITATHPLHFVSTHPVFYSTKKQCGISYTRQDKFNEFLYADDKNKYGVIIGNDVWIGTGVTLIGGICIGDGAVILANAVVTSNVQPYEIVGGIPAKAIKNRFADNQISKLLQLQWWNWPVDKIKKNYASFESIDNFLDTSL